MNHPLPRPGRLRPWLAALAFCLALSACAKKDKEHDPFLDEWRQKAEESQDKTYTPQKRKVEFSQLAVTPDNKPVDAKPARSLPVMRVSLNFYNTDLQAVLRSMARIAGQNIVLSAALQTPESQGKFKVSITVNEIPWDQAFTSILNANGLSFDWDGEIIRVMALEDLKQQNAMKKALEEKIAQQEKLKTAEPMVTAKVQVNYADVTELEKTLKGYLADKSQQAPGQAGQPGQPQGPAQPGGASSGEEAVGRVKGTVVADKHSNSIIIQASREHAELLVKLVERLDEPRLQIHLKAYIVEATRQALTDIGMQWGGAFRSGKDAFGNHLWIVPGGDTTVSSGIDPVYGSTSPYYGTGASGRGVAISFPAALSPTSNGSSLGAQGMALNFLYGSVAGTIISAQLTAMASEGKINIVSEPSLTTLDNAMAFTENGQRIPYVTTSQNGTNVQFQDAVLRLEMTPHVIDGQNLRMRLVIKNDEVVSDKTQWVQGNPPINKKQTETTLVVENGQTIIIAGLAKHNLTTSNQGVPGLKDIPYAGYLFKEDANSKNRQDILVFITPTILKRQDMAQAPQAGQARDADPDRRQAPPAKTPPGGDRAPMPMGTAPAPAGRPN